MTVPIGWQVWLMMVSLPVWGQCWDLYRRCWYYSSFWLFWKAVDIWREWRLSWTGFSANLACLVNHLFQCWLAVAVVCRELWPPAPLKMTVTARWRLWPLLLFRVEQSCQLLDWSPGRFSRNTADWYLSVLISSVWQQLFYQALYWKRLECLLVIRHPSSWNFQPIICRPWAMYCGACGSEDGPLSKKQERLFCYLPLWSGLHLVLAGSAENGRC